MINCIKKNFLWLSVLLIINANNCHTWFWSTKKDTRKAKDFYDHYNKINNTTEGKLLEKKK